MPDPNSLSYRRFRRTNSSFNARSSLLVFPLFLLLFFGCATTSETPEQQIDRLLEVTDMRREIQQLPAFIQEEIAGAPDSLIALRQARLAQILLDAYRPVQVLTALKTYLATSHQKDHATALLSSLSVPLANRIRTSEQAADQEKGDESRDAFALKMEQSPPSEARMKLVTSYAQTTGRLDLATEMVVSVMRTYYTVTSTIAEKDSLDTDVLEIMMATMETDINQGLNELFLLNTLYAFRDISDDDIKAYTELWETPEGQWFVETSGTGLRRALAISGRQALDRAKAER